MNNDVIEPFSFVWWVIVIVGGFLLAVGGPIILGALIGLAAGTAVMFVVGRVVDSVFDD